MGIFEQELNELRQLTRDWKAKKVSPEDVNTELQIKDRAFRIAAKITDIEFKMSDAGNRKIEKALMKRNIIGNRTSINLTQEEKENETIRCPINDRIITRAECLEYSGGHMDDCEGCHHNAETKKQLIDDVHFVTKD